LVPKKKLDLFEVSSVDDFISKYYVPTDALESLIRLFDEIKAYYGSWVLLFTSGIYFAGWLYILRKGLQVI
jgi:hypothetical protein